MTEAAASRSGAVGDVALVTSAAAGDHAAFEQLLEPRLGRLLRIARAILRDEALAHDVVQDACVQAWRELAKIRDPSRFDAWVSQIVVNGCRTELRRTSRRRITEITIDGVAEGESNRAAPGVVGLGDQVVESQAVRRAFTRLGPDDRALIVLHYVEDRAVGDIATILGIPSGTVKWRLSRARGALERALEAEE